MTSDCDSHPEMHRVPFRDPSLSEDLAEHLLSGRAAADDVPNAYRGLAALFETATAAPTAEEMAHKSTVVAAAVAAVGGAATVHSLAPDQLSRRRSMISKMLTAKAAAAATIAALGLGTAAAAMAGALPTQANSHATVNLTTSGSATTAGSTTADTNQGQGSGHTPDAVTNTHAQFGLCTAFLAHHPSGTTPSSVPSDSSKVFSALITLKGGLAGTVTYCQGVVATHSTSPDSTDKPDSTGTNQGAGKPSDAGSSNSKAPVSTPNSGGTGTAGTASHGASSSGSGNAGGH